MHSRYLILFLVALLPAGTAPAQSHRATGSGNWQDAGMWDPTTIPDSPGESAAVGDDTYPDVSALIDSSDVTIDWLTVGNGNSAGACTITQRTYDVKLSNGTELVLGTAGGGSGVYRLESGTLQMLSDGGEGLYIRGNSRFYCEGGVASIEGNDWSYLEDSGELVVTGGVFRNEGSLFTVKQSAKIRMYSGSFTNTSRFATRGGSGDKSRIYLHGGNITCNAADDAQRRTPFAFNWDNNASLGAYTWFFFDGEGTGVLYLRNPGFGQWNWREMTNQMVATEPRWYFYDPADPIDGGYPIEEGELSFTPAFIGGAEFTQIKPNLAVRNSIITDLGSTTGTFNGTLITTLNSDTEVSVFWGTSDGGTNKSSWDTTNTFPLVTAGDVPKVMPTNMTFSPGRCYYRYYASNAAGDEAWASATIEFFAISVWIEIVDTNASEEGMETASFLVWRSGGTNEQYEVNFDSSNLGEYQPIPDPIVIPVGQSNVLITLIPNDDWNGEGPNLADGLPSESSTITLDDDRYILREDTTTAITVWVTDNDCIFYLTNSGSWHEPENWNRDGLLPDTHPTAVNWNRDHVVIGYNDATFPYPEKSAVITGDVRIASMGVGNDTEGSVLGTVTQVSGTVELCSGHDLVLGREDGGGNGYYHMQGGTLALMSDNSWEGLTIYDDSAFYCEGGYVTISNENYLRMYDQGSLVITGGVFKHWADSIRMREDARIIVYSGSFTSRTRVTMQDESPKQNRIYLHGGDITINPADDSQRQTPFFFNYGNNAGTAPSGRFYFDGEGAGVLNLRKPSFGHWTFAWLTNKMVSAGEMWFHYDASDPVNGGYACLSNELSFTPVLIGGDEFTQIKPRPAIRNHPITNLGTSTGTFNGTLITTLNSDTEVSVFWGTSDGGTNKSDWDMTNTFPLVTAGDVPKVMPTNMTFSTGRYYYRYYASNAAGEEAWASGSILFSSVEIWIEAVDTTATEAGDTGQFILWRSGGTSEEYEVICSLVNSGRYAVVTNPIIIPVGQSNVTVTLTPVDNWYGPPSQPADGLSAWETSVTIDDIRYLMKAGTTTSVTVWIWDDEYNFYLTNSGDWHQPENWNRDDLLPNTHPTELNWNQDAAYIGYNDATFPWPEKSVVITGDVRIAGMYVGNDTESSVTGTVTQRSGTVELCSGTELILGGAGANVGSGYYHMEGGALRLLSDGGEGMYIRGDSRFYCEGGTVSIEGNDWSYLEDNGELVITGGVFRNEGSLFTVKENAKIRVYSGSITNTSRFATRGDSGNKCRIYLHGGDITCNAADEGQRLTPLAFNWDNNASYSAWTEFHFDPDGSGVLRLRKTDTFGHWTWEHLTNRMVATEPRWYIYDPADPIDGGTPCTATSLLYTITTIGGIEFTQIRAASPIIDNANGATNVTLANAWLNGTLYLTPRQDYAVYVYWGDNDGGPDRASWDNEICLGTNINPRPAALTACATGLVVDTLYYYKYCASNAYEQAWATDVKTFAVAPVKLGVIDDDAAEEGEDVGTFMISRSPGLTGGDLTVAYTIGGSADNGDDYEALSVEAVIPSGQTSVVVTVTPVDDLTFSEGPETVIVSLSAGAYIIGDPNTATITIRENDWAYYWNAGDDIWHQETNWLVSGTNGYPGLGDGDTAIIQNGGTANITTESPSLLMVGIIVGSDINTGIVVQDGSTVTVNSAVTIEECGRYTVSGGELYTPDDILLKGGEATLEVSGSGDVVAQDLKLLEGGESGSVTCLVVGGTLTVTNIRIGTSSDIGQRHAVIEQWDGEVVSETGIDLNSVNWTPGSASAAYKLYGGRLTVKDVKAFNFYLTGPASTGTAYVAFGSGELRLRGASWDYAALMALTNADFRLFESPLGPNDLSFTPEYISEYGEWYTVIRVALGIDNAAGVTDLTTTNATLNGTLVSTGNAPAQVFVFWGDNDGGTVKGNWDYTNQFPVHTGITPAPYSTNIALPVPGVNYFYRYYATNIPGAEGWATNTFVFMAGEIAVNGVDTNASEDGPDTATIQFSRPSGSSGADLILNYTLSGTATEAIDYEFLSGTVTIPQGSTNAIITITPLRDMRWDEGFETVIATVEPGAYLIGADSTGQIEIAEADHFAQWPEGNVRISFAGYDRAETLIDFPALVVFSTDIEGFSYDGFTTTNAADLRFLDSSRTLCLPYEIEEWNTNRESYIWVKVPELNPGTIIYAVWGNPSATELQDFTTNGLAWRSDYVAVWHLEEDVTDGGSGGTHEDSTRNDNDGTQYFNGQTNGLASFAQELAGTDYIDCGNRPDYNDITEAVTMSGWVKLSANGSSPVIMGRDSDLLELRLNGNTRRPEFQAAGEWTTAGTGDALAIGQWHYVAGTFDDAANTQALYVDGNRVAVSYPSGHLGHGGNLILGAGMGALQGTLDEARLSGKARSEDWIWACWMTMGRNDEFTRYTAGGLGTSIILR